MEHVPRNEYYTFQKVTQHGFDRLCYFNHGFIFVKLDITRKCVMFHWSVGRVSKLGAMSKTKVAQIDRIVRWYFPGESLPLEAVPQPRQSPSEKHPKRGFKGRPKDTLSCRVYIISYALNRDIFSYVVPPNED